MWILLNSKKFLITALLFGTVCAVFGSETGERITRLLIDKGINPYLVVMIIAALPIVELRGAIPIGIIFLKLSWIPVIVVSVLGNMIPVFFILYLFEAVERMLRKISFFNGIFDFLFKLSLKKSGSIEKYKELGLMFFVGIPLPATGAWTGSLIAYLLKLKYHVSIIYIFFGVLSAAAIVSAITYFEIKGLIVAIALFCLVVGILALKERLFPKK